jgi:hypothetical protein
VAKPEVLCPISRVLIPIAQDKNRTEGRQIAGTTLWNPLAEPHVDVVHVLTIVSVRVLATLVG